LCQEGYQQLFGGKLATVWSAPNYCYRFENLASILELDQNLNETFNIFEDAPENKRKQTKDEQRVSSISTGSTSSGDSGKKRMGGVEDFFL
jgi:serine/threonine-protein phosphatase PPG1